MGIKLNATKHCTRVDTTSQDEDNQCTANFGDMQEAPLEQQRHQPFLDVEEGLTYQRRVDILCRMTDRAVSWSV